MDIGELLHKFAESQGAWAAVFLLLLGWVMRENSKREAALMSFVKEVGPVMQKSCDLTNASIAIVSRIEGKIDACDVRHEKERVRRMAEMELRP